VFSIVDGDESLFCNPDSACRDRLLDSLRWLASVAESLEQTVVVETHLLTIMRSPEFNRAVIRDVGSTRMRLVMDYVNHFQSLHQVYDSRERLRHIFDCMGPVSAIGHCKDIAVRDGFVLHMTRRSQARANWTWGPRCACGMRSTRTAT